ncbi:hypothetical protein AB0X74_13695 [Kurthia gibsonii]
MFENINENSDFSITGWHEEQRKAAEDFVDAFVRIIEQYSENSSNT